MQLNCCLKFFQPIECVSKAESPGPSLSSGEAVTARTLDTESSGHKSPLSTAVIIVISIAGVAVLAAIFTVWILWTRRASNKKVPISMEADQFLPEKW